MIEERMKQIQDLAEYAKSRLVVGERPDDVAMAKHAIDVIAATAVDIVGIADSVKRQADACEELAKAMHLQVEILRAQMGGANAPQISSE